MPREVSTGTTSIEFGNSLRIGIKPAGSAGPFEYLPPPYPTLEQLPKKFMIPTSGMWEVELTQICPNCSGATYSDPKIVPVTIP